MNSFSGTTVLITGLSGSGKTTLSRMLVDKFRESEFAYSILLDGDVLRKTISRDLGFSITDRGRHLSRVASLATDHTKCGALVVCALIAPFEEDRQSLKARIERHGRYLEVYLRTPLHICEARDPKGLYRKAKLGQIKEFSGIDSPYQVPRNPDISLDTSDGLAANQTELIAELLVRQRLNDRWKEARCA